MATTINADTTIGGAIVTGDASGVLALQAAGSTQVTINGSGVVLANPLPIGSGGTGATSLSGITTGTATNIAGGSNGTIPYQSASGTTQMLAVGTSGQVLQTNGVAAPTWVSQSTLSVGTATNATNATNATTATSATTSTNLAGGSNGTIPYQSAAGTTQMLAVGTSGQVLQTNGAGAPTWVTPGGGSWIFITTVTASAAATVDVESSFDSTYDMYVIVGVKMYASADRRLSITLKVGGSYATDYSYCGTQFFSNAAQSTGSNQNDTSIRTSPSASLSGSNSFMSSLVMYIPNPSGTATFKTVFGQLSGMDGSQVNSNVFFSGNHTSAGSAGALTGVRFAPLFGGTLNGTFRLYGIKNS